MSKINSSKKIKLLMVENDYSQAAMSQLLGMSASTFNSKLNGKAPWKADECAAVARLFGLPVEEVFPEIFKEVV